MKCWSPRTRQPGVRVDRDQTEGRPAINVRAGHVAGTVTRGRGPKRLPRLNPELELLRRDDARQPAGNVPNLRWRQGVLHRIGVPVDVVPEFREVRA